MVKVALKLKREADANARAAGHSPDTPEEVATVLHGSPAPEHSDAGRVDDLPVVLPEVRDAVSDPRPPRDFSELSVEEKIKIWRGEMVLDDTHSSDVEPMR